jgi:hypothetical protein
LEPHAALERTVKPLAVLVLAQVEFIVHILSNKIVHYHFAQNIVPRPVLENALHAIVLGYCDIGLMQQVDTLFVHAFVHGFDGAE